MTTDEQVVELADRHSCDLDVVLCWVRRSGQLWVAVTHEASGRVARIGATPANALRVFYHPFAYGRSGCHPRLTASVRPTVSLSQTVLSPETGLGEAVEA